MDLTKNGMSTRFPCLLDKTNYGYWKINMSVFIKSLGMEVWESIVTGRFVPTKVDNGENVVKD